ncbi:hypothetical protein TNCV_5046871 [Trichonephila clavipes]|nr:hypothetical protein TNCV_5046871 [Trichonephila clavipes]
MVMRCDAEYTSRHYARAEAAYDELIPSKTSSRSLLKLVKRFEETGKLEDRARAGRPCFKKARFCTLHCYRNGACVRTFYQKAARRF